MLTAVDMSRLIDRIYAAGESGSWDDCLEMVCAALDGTGAHLFQFTDAPAVLGTVRTDPVSQEEFAAYYHRVEPRESRMPARTMALGRVLPGAAILPHTELQKTEYYVDFARRYDLTRVLFGVTGNLATGSRFALSVNRGDSQPEFDRRTVDFLAALLPHFGRALEVRARWASVDLRQQASLEVLDALPFGVLLVDGECRVCVANARGSRLLASRDGIATDAGRLRGMNAAATRRLRDICAEIANTREDVHRRAGAVLKLPRASGSGALQVMVAPVQTRDVFTVAGRDVVAVLYITDPAEVVVPDEAVLRSSFGLTPAESRVATRLAAGDGVEEICDELRYTRETARWYVKQVLAKAGCRTRSEFVARAARSIAILRAR